MNKNDFSQYWDSIYASKDTKTDVSWYQSYPKTSIELIEQTGKGKNSSVIDIGGGDSELPGALLELNYRNIYVLDISELALA